LFKIIVIDIIRLSQLGIQLKIVKDLQYIWFSIKSLGRRDKRGEVVNKGGRRLRLDWREMCGPDATIKQYILVCKKDN
jgi:hypothetical protein